MAFFAGMIGDGFGSRKTGTTTRRTGFSADGRMYLQSLRMKMVTEKWIHEKYSWKEFLSPPLSLGDSMAYGSASPNLLSFPIAMEMTRLTRTTSKYV